MLRLSPRPATPVLRSSDLAYVNPLRAAPLVDGVRGPLWALLLMGLTVVVAVAWAAWARVDVVTKAPARIVPEGREQLVASLEGGILRELKVREGDEVRAGQALAELDPTRLQAQRGEVASRRLALLAAAARAEAEARGAAPVFPPEVRAQPALVQGETASYQARAAALAEALAANRRSLDLLQRELTVAEQMAAKGLMSEVEVMRLRRQAIDLQQQSQERVSRTRQDAAAELVRVRNELAQIGEQQVVRDDMLRRTVLQSPVNGIVKAIRVNTVGGVISPGAPVMEIVPVGDTVLVELRIRPADIGFVQTGQAVVVKLSAYDHALFGTLKGQVMVLGPDAMGDADRAAADGTWYRALVRADASALQAQGRPLPVRPGMLGTGEIRTGERRVLSYLLNPMLRAGEAFRER